MSRADLLLAAITKELDRRKREIENENSLVEVHFRAKFDKPKRLRLQTSVYTERDIEDIIA